MNVKRVICSLKGHHNWKFAYNHGIPLGTKMTNEEMDAGFKSRKFFAVHRCETCKIYDHENDGLNPGREN